MHCNGGKKLSKTTEPLGAQTRHNFRLQGDRPRNNGPLTRTSRMTQYMIPKISLFTQ